MTDPVERIHPRNMKTLADELGRLVRLKLWAQILVGMVLGVGTGLALSPATGWVSADTARLFASWLSLPGDLFLVAIQMVVVPLIIASVVRGIAASGDVRQLRRTGLGLAIYFLVTTILAIALGLATGYLVRPGTFVSPEIGKSLAQTSQAPETTAVPDESLGLSDVPDAIVRLMPQNPLGAMVEGEMLQVVILGIVLGLALISIAPSSAKPLLDLMGSVQQVAMRIVSFVMTIAPLAVFGLLAEAMIHAGAGIIVGVGVYAASVVGALLLLMGLYLVIVATLGRRSPFSFVTHIREAQLLAFSTDSSAATMPVSARVAEEKLKVRPSTAQLVIPIGATVNMGGTACYHGIATIFMAQLFGMDLPAGAILALMLTSLGASVGAPATPGVGIMILAGVLSSAGIPLSGLILIIGFDQILERVRCVMNVTGDLVACVVMDRFAPGPLSREQEVVQERKLDRKRAAAGADVVTT